MEPIGEGDEILGRKSSTSSYNAYGPHDDFGSEKSHVILALNKRVFDGEDPVVV